MMVLGDIRRTPGDLDAAFVIVNKARISKGAIQYFSEDHTIEDCVANCVKHLGCVSFNYNPSNGDCELLSGKFNNDDVVMGANDWWHYDTPERSTVVFHYLTKVYLSPCDRGII